MRSAGVDTQEEIFADGILHRVRVDGDRAGTRNGWYVLHSDGLQNGRFGCHKRGVDETWSARDSKTFTSEEKAVFADKMEESKKQRDENLARLNTECCQWCTDTWQKVKNATGYHPYLKAKGVQSYGLKQLGDSLLVPVRDVTGTIQGMQFIYPDGSKKFKTGTAKQGNYFSIGRPQENILLICEGYATGASLHESTGHAVAVSFDAGNLLPVAENLRTKFPDMKLIICADNDESEVGQQKAQEAAVAVGGVVAMPPETGDDFNDLHQKKGSEAVKNIIDALSNVTDNPTRYLSVTDTDSCRFPETQACDLVTDRTPPPNSNNKTRSLDETVARLALLSPLEYDKIRKEEAASLGVRAPALDQAIKETRKNGSADTDLPFKEVEPWPEPIHPAELLSEIGVAVRRFIVCDVEISNAVALWIAMTWFMGVVHVAPLAVITAPEKRCGKSQLLTLIGRLVYRAITASSISPAALFRAIDAWEPTLLIDEVDACMKDNEELRGIINSGHTRDSAYVIRTVGETFTPTKFSTWGPKALSGIGHVADTLMDRAVILELRRKLSHENVERLRYAEPGFFENLGSKLCRFSIDYSEHVRQARPYLPPSLNDRAQDNWEPLLAIAMVAGPEWLELATQTALKISGTESAVQSIGVELLIDIQEVFEEKAVDRISTADLIKALVEDDEKPWATYNRGMQIRPRQLASKLKGYDIASKTVRFNTFSTSKGYEKKQFEEAFSRYIPSLPPEKVTRSQTSASKDLPVTFCDPAPPFVTDKLPCEPAATAICDLVTDRKSHESATNHIEVII